MSAPASIRVTIPPAPYKGLESYQYSDSAIFTSRERDAEKLLRLITIYRCVLLYGAQGAGKSSLINAAFLPKAIAEGFTPELLRVHAKPGQEIVACRIEAEQPGGPPYLRSNLCPNDSEPRVVMSMRDLISRIEALPETEFPLLIFDQFEELVSQFEESPSEISRTEALNLQLDLMASLIDLARSEAVKAKILFTFRQDYLAKLGRMFVQVPNLLTTSLFLQPLSAQHLSDVVRGPFLRFPDRYTPQITPALADAIEEAFRERSPLDELNLSEVQLVCLSLWQSADPQTAFKELGVDGVLRRYFSGTLAKIPKELVAPAVALLGALVTDTNVRNVVDKENLIYLARQKKRQRERSFRVALDHLEAAGLVRHERRGEVLLYEIVSESLIPWIRQQQAKERTQAQVRRWAMYAGIAIVLALLTMTVSGIFVADKTQRLLSNALVQSLRTENDGLRKANAALEQKSATGQAELERARRTVEQQRAEYGRLLASASAGKPPEQAAVLGQLQKEAATKAAALEAAEKKNSEFAGQLAALKTSFDAAVTERDKLRNELQQRAQAPQEKAAPTPPPVDVQPLKARISELEANVDKLGKEREAIIARMRTEPESKTLQEYSTWVPGASFAAGRVAMVTEKLPRNGPAKVWVTVGESALGLKPGSYPELVTPAVFPNGPDEEKLKGLLKASGGTWMRAFDLPRSAGRTYSYQVVGAYGLNFRIVAVGSTSTDMAIVLIMPLP